MNNGHTYGMAIDRSGKFLFRAVDSATISRAQIDNNGKLVPLLPIPGNGINSILMPFPSPDSDTLYVIGSGDTKLGIYGIEPNGTLTWRQNKPVPSGLTALAFATIDQP
jgi:hypothetical protein